MNPMPEITPMLKELRLSGVMDSLETRNRQAIEEKLAYTDFLAIIKPLNNLTLALIRPSTGL
jgi:hypothetical protein